MLHRQAAVDELLQRVNADVQMRVQERLRHLLVARGGLDALGCHRLVGHE